MTCRLYSTCTCMRSGVPYGGHWGSEYEQRCVSAGYAPRWWSRAGAEGAARALVSVDQTGWVRRQGKEREAKKRGDARGRGEARKVERGEKRKEEGQRGQSHQEWAGREVLEMETGERGREGGERGREQGEERGQQVGQAGPPSLWRRRCGMCGAAHVVFRAELAMGRFY